MCPWTPGLTAPPECDPSGSPSRPRTRSSPTRSWTIAPAARRAHCSLRGSRPATASRSPSPPARTSSPLCTAVSRPARSRSRSTCGWAPPSAPAARRARPCWSMRHYAGPPVTGTRTLWTEEVATVVHTSGTTSQPRPVALSYGNWLAERARLGRRARARPGRAVVVPDAADPRRRPVDPVPQRDLRNHGRAPRALRRRRGGGAAVRPGAGDHGRLARADDARAAARRRPRAPADAPLGTARRRPDRAGAARPGPRGRASRSPRPMA